MTLCGEDAGPTLNDTYCGLGTIYSFSANYLERVREERGASQPKVMKRENEINGVGD